MQNVRNMDDVQRDSWLVHLPPVLLLGGRRARRILLGSEYFVAIIFSAVALAPVLGPRPVLWIVVPGVLLLLLTSLALMIPASRKLTGSLRGGASTHYKAGLFYVNPHDPALWVPKRMGVGYTLNFAHAKAWWILGLLLLVPIALAVLLGLLTAR